jgi:hypothetical protein
MSVDTQIDNKAAQPRLVIFPHPSGDTTRDDYPVVQFPSPAEMSEKDFHEAAAQAWPELLAEHVRNTFPHRKEEHTFIDTMAEHILAGKMGQAKQYARAWKDARNQCARSHHGGNLLSGRQANLLGRASPGENNCD